VYSPQANIPLMQNGSKLFVSAGGIPSYDTF
jgi:hypothetical protein